MTLLARSQEREEDEAHLRRLPERHYPLRFKGCISPRHPDTPGTRTPAQRLNLASRDRKSKLARCDPSAVDPLLAHQASLAALTGQWRGEFLCAMQHRLPASTALRAPIHNKHPDMHTDMISATQQSSYRQAHAERSLSDSALLDIGRWLAGTGIVRSVPHRVRKLQYPCIAVVLNNGSLLAGHTERKRTDSTPHPESAARI